MKSESEKARTRFHDKLTSMRSVMLEDTETGHVLDLTNLDMWGARIGGWSFVISRDIERGNGNFTISIRPAHDRSLEAVGEFEAYKTLSAAKDACYDYYCRFRKGDVPHLKRPTAHPRPGERFVTLKVHEK